MTLNEPTNWCADCRFYDSHPGACHRYAPRPINLRDGRETGEPLAIWPEVEPDDWCGEFQAKEEKDAAKP